MAVRTTRPRGSRQPIGYWPRCWGRVLPVYLCSRCWINDTARHRLQEVGMRNAPEVVREVGVHDFRMTTEQQLLHLYDRLLGVSPGAVGVDFWRKIGFKNRLQHQQRCCHADPISHDRDAQWPEFAIGFRYK